MAEQIARITSRKFLLALSVVLCATVLADRGRIDKDTWTMVTLAALGGYATANVAQRKVKGSP